MQKMTERGGDAQGGRAKQKTNITSHKQANSTHQLIKCTKRNESQGPNGMRSAEKITAQDEFERSMDG